LEEPDDMADTTTYFGNAVRATYPDGSLIIVNGRPLLIPEKNYSLQQQIDAARYQASRGLAAGALTKEWFLQHFPAGGSGDPQRQAGWSGGFDARFTDAGNYGYGLSAAAAGMSLDNALKRAAEVNKIGTAKPSPAVNERAIRQGYDDYLANLFPKGNVGAGQAYVESVYGSDLANAAASLPVGTLSDAFNSHIYNRFFNSQAGLTDVQRYAKARWAISIRRTQRRSWPTSSRPSEAIRSTLISTCCSRCRPTAAFPAARTCRCSSGGMVRS
jgi:hypothetical protein